jgi:hypothetical protein
MDEFFCPGKILCFDFLFNQPLAERFYLYIFFAEAGTGKSAPPFSVGAYFYGIYPIVTLIFRLPVIGGMFPSTL